jgi:acyl-CoA synthetase (NDP forming)
MCADACGAAKLDVPELSQATRLALADFLPTSASLGNPVDMIAGADHAAYEQAMGVMAGSGEVDALIVIFIPPLKAETTETAIAIRRAAGALHRRLPVLAVLLGGDVAGGGETPHNSSVPVYAFPENAVQALARVADWAEWRRRPQAAPSRPPNIRSDQARAIVATTLRRGDGWLAPEAVARLLGCYGVTLADWRQAPTPEEAAAAAAELGGMVALKAVGPQLLHKSELGAVQLSLRPQAVASEARRMAARQAAAGIEVTGFLVQRMVPKGVEMIVGVVQDPVFGPVVACGAGGVAVELMKDVSVRLAPLSEADAERMLSGLVSFPLLEGYRGGSRVDMAALKGLLLQVSALADDLPEVVELDLNPVVATSSSVVTVDARLRIEARDPQRPEGSLFRAVR